MERSYQSSENETSQIGLAMTSKNRVMVSLGWARMPILTLLSIVVIAIALIILNDFRTLTHDAPMLIDSTVGELALWMANQAGTNGVVVDADMYLDRVQNLMFGWGLVITALVIAGLSAAWANLEWCQWLYLLAMLAFVGLLFVIPVVDDNNSPLFSIMAAITIMLIMLLMTRGDTPRIIGFFVVLSTLLVMWEVVKFSAELVDYRITMAQPAWEYTTYPSVDTLLDALKNQKADAVIVDRKDVRDLIPEYPVNEEADSKEAFYPDLRILAQIEKNTSILALPVTPEFAGRLTVVVRDRDVDIWHNAFDLMGENIAAVEGSYADAEYLSAARNLVLVDLRIFNDLNLPHVQNIAEAFLQPARRNGESLLISILGQAALYTWQEAFYGFLIGSCLGFVLGIIFAHSPLLERSILPYVVASQTVPILAIAPMVVIWLGASALSVAVIAAYITFFPVTINTLRGLLSPKPTEIELLRSYGASRRDILWKLRVPSALPYIFTALKVSATSSVVGAIIGELPSGISDGLGRAILNFSSDYSLISTPKLWAAIITAACVGIIFFVAVSILEHIVLHRYIRGS